MINELAFDKVSILESRMKNASVWWPVISQLRPETISFSKRKICFANRKGSFRYGLAGSEDLQPHYVA